MNELIRMNWKAFDVFAVIKISLGLAIMLWLQGFTGQPWLATALAAMFAWMANSPGPLTQRVLGMLAFAAGAAALTLVYGLIGKSLPLNICVIAVVGFLGTAALLMGMRSFMVGFAIICWAIYGPLMVASTDVHNSLLAIAVGTGVVVLLNVVGDILFRTESPDTVKADSNDGNGGVDQGYIIAYAVVVAMVLAFNYQFGFTTLQTDPTLALGGAFFVIGFDVNKTWVMGIARVLGLVLGVLVGLLLANVLGPGPILNAAMILACGLSFGAAGVNPSAWMFFFMVFVAIGWPALDPEAFELVMDERFTGELVGITSAMIAIVFLQWWHSRRDI